MIRRLNLREPNEVQSLLNIQRLAYRIEADLIGFNDIPTLKDTIYSLQECKETFYGYFANTMLCGAISYTREKRNGKYLPSYRPPSTVSSRNRQGVSAKGARS